MRQCLDKTVARSAQPIKFGRSLSINLLKRNPGCFRLIEDVCALQ